MCMSCRGSFVTSSLGTRCGGGEEAREEEGVMSPDARSLCEGLEARLRSSESARLGHSSQPFPAYSRSWDILAADQQGTQECVEPDKNKNISK
jgi:hypothetical protein